MSLFPQLKTAAQAFMEGDDVTLDLDKKVISVSKIFSWYKEDFGGSDSAVSSLVLSIYPIGNKSYS